MRGAPAYFSLRPVHEAEPRPHRIPPRRKRVEKTGDSGGKVVPGTGVEPARPCEHQILSLARLPIPPPGHGARSYGSQRVSSIGEPVFHGGEFV